MNKKKYNGNGRDNREASEGFLLITLVSLVAFAYGFGNLFLWSAIGTGLLSFVSMFIP